MQKLVLASNNTGKVKEFQALLAPLNFQVIPSLFRHASTEILLIKHPVVMALGMILTSFCKNKIALQPS
uniref:Non-canonical purine NTP pyrophosphatase n=1 Tax=Polynucleobacter necessarius subsp. necessarius (strain STIR1) TaxID=452638 RepID=B1XUH3_POLNS